MRIHGTGKLACDDLVSLKLFGVSPAWLSTIELVRRIARNDATVLIEGETGTGKEVVARAIHTLGARHAAPFLPVNCGALADSLLEAELFGHERGAFTDARERRPGLVAQARGGTLFLDEVEAMTPRAQVVLLRFVQDQTYLPVGARNIETADVRIVAASNVDLAELVASGAFRGDLLFRLRVLGVKLPTLRDRTGDVTMLASRFLDRISQIHGRPPRRIAMDSLAALEAYTWPGNVRELESLILREFLLTEDDADELVIDTNALALSATPRDLAASTPADFKRAKAQAVADFERRYLQQLLTSVNGNVSKAARLASKDRSALNRLIRKHGMQAEDFRLSVVPPRALFSGPCYRAS